MLICVIFSQRIFIVVVIFRCFYKLFLIDNMEWFLYPQWKELSKTMYIQCQNRSLSDKREMSKTGNYCVE